MTMSMRSSICFWSMTPSNLSEGMPAITISFGGSSVSVAYGDERAAGIVDFLCRHMPISECQREPDLQTYRLEKGEKGDLFLYQGSKLLHKGSEDGFTAEILLSGICHDLADKSRGGLLFHAAVLAFENKGILLPGGIGAGKTTLALFLASKGYSYLSDELAYIEEGQNIMQALTRPLNLKEPSREVLKRDFHFQEEAGRMMASSRGDLISPDSLGPVRSQNEMPADVILFPRYGVEKSFRLEPLSKAQTVLRLSECLINARNLPDNGFPEAIRLAKTVAAYRLEYSCLDGIQKHIKKILARR